MTVMLTAFEIAVLKIIKQVPKGKVTTYKAVASALGRPGAARAVGNALDKNPHPVAVPCHRVVLSDGRLGGYAGGAREKKRLLKQEGVKSDKGKIVGFERVLFKTLRKMG